MKRRSPRSLLIAAQIAFHAIVMVCGPSLHALPGWGHGEVKAASANERHPGDHVPPPHGVSDHCLVCQFLAQGQLPAQAAHAFTAPLITRQGPPELPAPSPLRSRSWSRPRAPPRPSPAFV